MNLHQKKYQLTNNLHLKCINLHLNMYQFISKYVKQTLLVTFEI